MASSGIWEIPTYRMNEHVVLRKSDKEILEGEKDESDFQDFSTRKSQIRTRVRRRGDELVDEIDLLHEAGENAIARELVRTLCSESEYLIRAPLESRIEEIERKIEEIERQCSDVERIKTEIDEIKEELAFTTRMD